MKILLLLLIVILQGTALSDERHVSFDHPESEGSTYTWLPVTLTEAERKILAKRSDPPRTALDYYLLLPGQYFENIVNREVERRITFIDQDTLSDQYLHAQYTIPSTDAGAFWITIRIFERGEVPLIAIRHRRGLDSLYWSQGNRADKLWSITLGRPEFWRYRDRALLRVDDAILPGLAVEDIVDRYRNHYKAHLNHPAQQKSIYLGYDLPQDGDIVRVTGRENFMSPEKTYVWAEFVYKGDRFAPSSNSEQDGADQPATAPESRPEGE